MPTDTILDFVDIAILSTNAQGIILQANEATCRQFGYTENEMVGLPLQLLLPPQLRQNHEQHLIAFANLPNQERAMQQRIDIIGYRKDGTQFPAEASITRINTPAGLIFIATLHDTTSIKKTEENLTWRAEHDALTGLPNRILIHDRLENALHRSKRSGELVALMFIDLDDFKRINDNYGHDFGDQILVTIGNRLVNTVRPGDSVGRFGGDEFVIICDQIQKTSIAEELANRIVEAFREPLSTQFGDVYATTSIGLTIGNGNTDTAELLLRHADAAMYSVKDKGRNSWGAFNEQINLNTKQQLKIVNGLRRAIDKNELSLHFQPIIDIHSGQTIAAEALLRWQHKAQSISPDLFIPIAEMSGSILPIGRWVFEEACKTLASWCATFGRDAPNISINLSARQLDQDDLPQMIRDTLVQTKAPAEKITLEITETSLMSDIEKTLPVLIQIASLGITFAVDDFGTGYSSLAQLMRLPVETIKIDRAFIQHIEDEADKQAITSAIISMAHSLDIKTTAEGVENAQHASILKQHQCDFAQGYFFARPMSADNIYSQLYKHA